MHAAMYGMGCPGCGGRDQGGERFYASEGGPGVCSRGVSSRGAASCVSAGGRGVLKTRAWVSLGSAEASGMLPPTGMAPGAGPRLGATGWPLMTAASASFIATCMGSAVRVWWLPGGEHHGGLPCGGRDGLGWHEVEGGGRKRQEVDGGRLWRRAVWWPFELCGESQNAPLWDLLARRAPADGTWAHQFAVLSDR